MISKLEREFLERERTLQSEAETGRGALLLPAQWMTQRDKRIAECQSDFFAFALAYFPDFFPYAFSRAHRHMIRDAMRTDRPLAIYAAPRGFGKTMLFRVFKLWAVIFGKRMHIGQVSDTIDLAVKDLRHLRTELKYNPRLVTDFGDLIGDADNAYEVEIRPHKLNPKGARITAYSTTVTARGALFRAARPDLFIFDDFEDFSTSINADISKYKLEVIMRDFYPALAETGSAVYLGNNARTTCLINTLVEMPEADRTALYPAIELNILDAWDEKNNRPLWHERYKYENEEDLRSAMGVSLSVWMAEYRQRPQPPEGARFRLDYWKHYETFPRDARGIIWYDPALGSSSDYKAMALLFYSPSTNKFLAPEAFCRRCDWETLFLAMYDLYNKYRNHLLYIAWEANFGQAKFYEFKNVYISTRGLPELPIRFLVNEGEKFWRIEQLEHPYTLGSILFGPNFLSTPDGVEAQNQLIGYQGRKTDKHRIDFPDALASAYRILWPTAMNMGKSIPSLILGEERRTY